MPKIPKAPNKAHFLSLAAYLWKRRLTAQSRSSRHQAGPCSLRISCWQRILSHLLCSLSGTLSIFPLSSPGLSSLMGMLKIFQKKLFWLFVDSRYFPVWTLLISHHSEVTADVPAEEWRLQESSLYVESDVMFIFCIRLIFRQNFITLCFFRGREIKTGRSLVAIDWFERFLRVLYLKLTKFLLW